MGMFGAIGTAVGSFFGGPTGGSIGGAIGGAIDQSDAQSAANQTNDQNIALMRENRQWQETMANTAHQREVADLKAAGLNPMISAMGGSGAATPSPTLTKVENSAATAAKQSADEGQAALMRAQIQTAQSQIALNSAQAAKVNEEARGASAAADMAQLDAKRAAFNQNDRLGAENKEFIARQADAVAKNLERQNDYNSLTVLNEVAREMGYASYQAAMKNTEFQQKVVDLYQTKLKNPEYEAFAKFYHSDYGKNVAPYVHSAAEAARGASALVPAVKLFK